MWGITVLVCIYVARAHATAPSHLQAMQAEDAEGEPAPAVDTDNGTGLDHTGMAMQDAPGPASEQPQPAVGSAAGEDVPAGPLPTVGPLSGHGMQSEGATSLKRNVRKRVVEAGVSSRLWSYHPSQTQPRLCIMMSNW